MAHTIPFDATDLPIKAVCVHQNSAEVTRIIPLSLKAGQNEVIIDHLTSSIDTQKIRVEGIGKGVTVYDVAALPDALAHPGAANTVPDELRPLKEKIDTLKAEKAINDEQARILDDYSKTLKAGEANHETLKDFLKVYKEQMADIRTSTRDLQNEIDTLEAEFTKEEARRKRRNAKVVVCLLAEVDGSAELSLMYTVYGVSWSPLYDIRANINPGSTEKTSVTLVYRATINQDTAEDWNNVALSLSTAAPQYNTDIPVLTPALIGPPLRRPPVVLRSAAPMITRSSRSAFSEDVEVEAYAATPMMMMEATVTKSATSALFSIPGSTTIPSDGSQSHKVTIATIDMQAHLEWVAVPKLHGGAFLQVINNSEYDLISGSASVYMDGNFICNSSVPDVSPRERFSASLGVDPAVRVTYHNRLQAKRSAGGVLATKTDVNSFTQRISVKNNRSTPIYPLYVKDQIPVSEDNELKVSVLEPKDIGAAKDRREVLVSHDVKARFAFKDYCPERAHFTGEEIDSTKKAVEEDGVIEWVCNLGAGKSIDLTLVYEIVAPQGKQWMSDTDDEVPNSQPEDSSMISFTPSAPKRTRSEAQLDDDGDEQEESQQPEQGTMGEQLGCGICLSLMNNPFLVLPNANCPVCKQRSNVAKHNFQLENIIAQYRRDIGRNKSARLDDGARDDLYPRGRRPLLSLPSSFLATQSQTQSQSQYGPLLFLPGGDGDVLMGSQGMSQRSVLQPLPDPPPGGNLVFPCPSCYPGNITGYTCQEPIQMPSPEQMTMEQQASRPMGPPIRPPGRGDVRASLQAARLNNLPGAASHNECAGCSTYIPTGWEPRKQKCGDCDTILCSNYDPEGCPDGSKLLPRNALSGGNIVARTLWGSCPVSLRNNEEELSRFDRYLSDQNLSMDQVLERLADIKLHNEKDANRNRFPGEGEEDAQEFAEQWREADAECDRKWGPDSFWCDDSVQALIAQTFFRWWLAERVTVPANLQDCWYGYECRTQVRTDHALRYNATSMCVQTHTTGKPTRVESTIS
ncbi:hypothetical protein FRB99_001328 [Tulasnella sp. 403]|nr:hypothetical protein FRB99_001328 [Tulasnella sp. 403]